MGQAPSGLVHGNRRHIGPGLHGGNRKIFPEIQMGSMGLVRQHLHSPGMGHLNDRPDIRTDPVIRRIVDEHRHRVRVILNGLLYLFHFHSQRDPQLLVHLRIYVNRNRAAKHHGVDHALMDVPGQDDLVSGLADREDHALDRRSGSAHHQIRRRRSKGVRGQLLRLPDHGDGMA